MAKLDLHDKARLASELLSELTFHGGRDYEKKELIILKYLQKYNMTPKYKEEKLELKDIKY